VERMTRGLVLSGGGSRGSFQIGALECLYKRFGYSADVIAGPSVGAVNGMGLAQGVGAAAQIAEIDKLLALWRALDGLKCISSTAERVPGGRRTCRMRKPKDRTASGHTST